MKIVWSKFAKITYFEILENVQDRWGSKVVIHFISTINKVLEDLTSGNVEWPIVDKRRGIRKIVINSNISLFYKVNQKDKKYFLVTFFNNKMNPEKLKQILRKK